MTQQPWPTPENTRYATEQDALDAVARLGVDLTAYECICGMYHLRRVPAATPDGGNETP